MKVFFFLPLFLAPVLATNISRAPGKNGPHMEKAGLLIPDFEKLPGLAYGNMAYLPNKGLPLYSRPKGERHATLSRFCPVGKFEDGHMRMFVLPDSTPNNCQHIRLEQLYHMSDDAYVIPFTDRQDGFVLLFDGKSPFWAKISDIADQHFVLTPWAEYLVRNRQAPCHPKSDNMPLRLGPDGQARVLATLTRRDHITLLASAVSELSGNWCRVRVTWFKEDPCKTQLPENENLLKTLEGWIELTDSHGLPNVHVNAKGC